MRIAATTLQRGLTVLGYNPGPVDGDVGPLTLAALDAWIASFEDGRTYSITPLERGHALDITPTGDTAATLVDTLTALAREYRAPSSQATSSRLDTSPGGVPLVVSTPVFWRMGNPWAWAAFLLPLSVLLGGVGFFFLRSPRGRR